MKTLLSLITRLIAIILTVVVVFAACKKQDDTSGTAGQEEFATATAQSDAAAEVIFNDVFDNVMGVNTEVGIGGTGVFGRAIVSNTSGPSTNRIDGVDSVACYTVTIMQLNPANRFPLQIVMDFGSGCTGKDGRTRKGKIIAVYTGKLTTPGNSATVTFDGYYVDDIKVEGYHKISNTSTLDRKSFTTVVSNAKLSQSADNFIAWNSNKTIVQTEGMTTPLIPIDDVFNITGQANGAVQLSGKYFEWSATITTPLVKRFSCPWISKGTLTLGKGNVGVAVLDYGPGTCDNKATFSVNGTVHEITLH
jgi:hypothetical protein